MKKYHLLIAACLIATGISGQSPGSFKYQAVARDAAGDLMTNQPVNIVISILQGSASGTEVFSETHDSTTNQFGLVTLNVGEGNPTDFANIAWSNAPYFLKVVMDGNEMGTTQLLSVPYAKYADTAGNVFSGDYNDLGNKPVVDGSETKINAGTNVSVTGTGTSGDPYEISASGSGSAHYIGELYGGGIVFYIYDNGQHGLIASLDNLDASGVAWSATLSSEIGSSAQSYTDGASNTAAIVAQDNTPGYAATLCDSYSNDGFTDWYLPAAWELSLLYNASFAINDTLENDGNGSTNGLSAVNTPPAYGRYWSSTEYDIDNAWFYRFSNNASFSNGKGSLLRVRAIRKF